MTAIHTAGGSVVGLPTTKARLVKVIESKSLRIEQPGNEILLSSGKKSRVFFDLKMTMLDPEGSCLIAEMLFNKLKSEFNDAAAIGGLEMGAVPIVSQLCLYSHMVNDPISAFFVRKKAKGHGTQKLVEGIAPNGASIVVLDDVTTTGGSTLQAIDTIKEHTSCNVVGVISIVDRQEGAVSAFADRGITFRPLLSKEDFTEAL